MIHLPRWTHLLNKVGEILFVQKLLPELAEYLRLTQYAPCFVLVQVYPNSDRLKPTETD